MYLGDKIESTSGGKRNQGKDRRIEKVQVVTRRSEKETKGNLDLNVESSLEFLPNIFLEWFCCFRLVVT
jgi:hypothetical protein